MSASIRLVAAAAGVSKSTASLALRNHPSVAEETRLRVKAAALKIGYRVNPLVSALMTQQRAGQAAEGAPLLALVDLYGAPARPRANSGAIRLPESAERHIAAGHAAARAAAQRYGYRLDILSARAAGMTPERLRQVTLARGVRGILLMMPPAPETPPAWQIDWGDRSVVHLGSPDSPYHHVRPNIIGTVQVLLAELGRRGYRRPGLCVPLSNERYSGFRWQMAFRQHFAMTPGADDFVFMPDRHDDLKVVMRWIQREKPDVVAFIGSAELEGLNNAGLRAPEDIGYVALHLLREDFGKVAGMDLRYDARYDAALQLLDSLLRHNEAGRPEAPLAVTVPGRWMDGPTVRPVTEE